MGSQNSLHKLCFPLILMFMVTEVKDTSESYTEREDMCISILISLHIILGRRNVRK